SSSMTFFFFSSRRRHTRSKRDWSSDLCSSDLMAIGLLLFLIPGGANRGVRLLDWETAEKLPWGVLLLFGGGLALSAQFSDSGLTEWIGETSCGVVVLRTVIVVAFFAGIFLFLTEL